MNKGEIKALDNESLLAHLIDLETLTTHEENNRGLTQKTQKDYKWTLEEFCSRFNLDMNIVAEKTGISHWWEE